MSPLIWLGLIPFGALILATLIAYVFFGPRTIKHFGHDLTWVKCTDCTAGTQWWDGEKWGPIPPHARRVTEGVFTIEPPQANVRKHPQCLGTPGGHWVDPNGPRKLSKDTWRDTPKGPGEGRNWPYDYS